MTQAYNKRRPRKPVGAMAPVPVKAPDGWLIGVVVALVIIGTLAIFDASYVKAGESKFTGYDSYYYLTRQLWWVGVGTVAFLGGMYLGYWRLRRIAPLALLISVLLLVAVLIPHIGIFVAGARRWLGGGPVRFQPSEVAKIALVIYLAHFLVLNKKRIQDFKAGFLPALVPIGVVSLLILIEPDMGTMLATAGVSVALLFAGGAKPKHVIALIVVACALILLLAVLEPYRLQRLMVFRNPYSDPDGAGYQILQGLSALGSGGPLGLGLGESRAKWLYLPAEHTDFIYAIIGEEMGLFGTLGILGLFLVLVRRGFIIAGKCKNAFGTLLAIGIAMTIGLQAFMNIGVVTTLLPATGVPLPLISFGGSSLVLTLFALGILTDISRRPVLPWDNEDNDSRSNRRWDRGAYLSGAGDRRSARKPRRNTPLYRK
jgi:cell division protein FtsW